jgi:carboxyl-terminal processing protease
MNELGGSSESPQAPQPKKRKILRKLGIFLLSLVVLVVVFVAGNLASYTGIIDLGQLVRLNNPQTQSAATPSEETTTEQLAARLEEVAGLIDRDSLYRYTQEDLDTATTESINALLATSEDKYAHYFTPEEYEAYVKNSEGEYAGIGISLADIEGEITVVEVYQGSPAYDAAIKSGDVLIAVDGDSHDWELEEATSTIRRAEGEPVTILWSRAGEERETNLVTRAVNIPTVVTHLIEKDGITVGYLSLRGFNMQSGSELREGLLSLDAAGAQSFILDLRNNPGGYLEQAIDIVSLFEPTGTVVQVENRHGVTTREVTGKVVTDKPLVVLVNGNSASASELVAAALQDLKRATIVGELTYGKGSMQSLSTLSWGGALRYTIAHYMSPLGKTVDGVGVTPDITVAPASEPVDASLTNHIGTSSYQYVEGIDLQLDAALGSLLGTSPTQ